MSAPNTGEEKIRGAFANATEPPPHEETGGNGATPAREPWPAPGPLPPMLPPVPLLRHELIPYVLLAWVLDVAQRMQVPIDMVVIPAIVVIGSLIGRQLGILPKRFDDWVVIPNFWGAIVGRPGVLKTPAVAAAASFLAKLSETAYAEFELEIDRVEAERTRLEIEIMALMKVRKGTDVDAAQIVEKKKALRKLRAIERRYFTNDPTVEKLGELLNENPRGLLLLRDELTAWLRSLDKPGREGDREFYLETWKGIGAHRVDRVGRGSIVIKSLTLSVLGGIQPGKLSTYVSEALADGRAADGLLQRFQMLAWPDVTSWENVDRLPNREAIERARTLFDKLDKLEATTIGPPASNVTIPVPALRFTPEAQELFDAWREKLEVRLRDGSLSDCSAYESHVAKYRSLMPSLALVFHVIAVLSGEDLAGDVSQHAAKRAAAWVDEYLDLHARRVYAAELSPGPSAAGRLAKRIEAIDGMTPWEIADRGWSGLSHRRDVHAALVQLNQIGWVRIERREPGPKGGRPSEIVRVNPALKEKTSA